MRPTCLLRPLCLVLLLIPLLSRLPETACVLQEYFDCHDPYLFRCGGEEFNVSYPFLAGDRNEYCGFGERYNLSCRDGGIPVIEIGGRSYRVKRIDYGAGVLGVADLAASQNRTCPLAPYKAATLDWSLFEYTGDDHNLTLYGNCTPVSPPIPNLYEVPCLAFGDWRSYVTNPVEPPTNPPVIDCDTTAVVPLGGTAARSLNLADTGSLRKAMDEGFNLTWTLLGCGQQSRNGTRPSQLMGEINQALSLGGGYGGGGGANGIYKPSKYTCENSERREHL